MAKLTHERLLHLLSYDPETGLFVWKVQRSGKGKINAVAGCYGPGGYWQLRIDGVCYLGHRLAWFYVFGVWPKRLDHRDGKRTNNQICNLREATVSQNAANKKLQINNTSGFKGVRGRADSAGTIRWQAKVEVRHDGRRKSITVGTFDTPELASQAYRKEAEKHFGEFARVG